MDFPCALSPSYNPGGPGGRISLCRCHADSSPQQAQLSSATDLNSHHSDLGYCNFKNIREEECSIKENKVLQYKRQNCHLGDYHLEMLQTLFCQDWELRSSGKNCDFHKKEKKMKQSNGSLKVSPWGQEWYVCVIPELMHGKWVTSAGLRTPSARYYFKPGDH